MDSPRLGGFGERFGIERDGRMMDPWFFCGIVDPGLDFGGDVQACS